MHSFFTHISKPFLSSDQIFSSRSHAVFNLQFQGNKPEMERRRRARMNQAFEQLKKFHLMHSPNQTSKLEKTDVLELTVEYLKNLHENVNTSPPQTAHSPNQRLTDQLEGYREGFRVSFIQYTFPFHQASILSAGLTVFLSNYQQLVAPPPSSQLTKQSPKSQATKRSYSAAFPSSSAMNPLDSSSIYVPPTGLFHVLPGITTPTITSSLPATVNQLNAVTFANGIQQNFLTMARSSSVSNHAGPDIAHGSSSHSTLNSSAKSTSSPNEPECRNNNNVCVTCEGKCQCQR
ncbi:unnamed protein product [Anisakis simplex]|uniref:BHLH domain-containing protein n=1 Tax=Anisakis simplex TaxID=6269 RepID=A0A0M3K983_ANISI|nr:unnamed protein product [Anisakis simplex]